MELNAEEMRHKAAALSMAMPNHGVGYPFLSNLHVSTAMSLHSQQRYLPSIASSNATPMDSLHRLALNGPTIAASKTSPQLTMVSS